jgi:hypothetical protein
MVFKGGAEVSLITILTDPLWYLKVDNHSEEDEQFHFITTSFFEIDHRLLTWQEENDKGYIFGVSVNVDFETFNALFDSKTSNFPLITDKEMMGLKIYCQSFKCHFFNLKFYVARNTPVMGKNAYTLMVEFIKRMYEAKMKDCV